MSRVVAIAWMAFTIVMCGLLVGWLLGADYRELFLRTLPPAPDVECWMVERSLLRRADWVVVPGLDDVSSRSGAMFHAYDLYECDTGVEYWVRVR